VLPIWIGSGEANAILTKLKAATPAAMTHDLLQSLVDLVGASVLRVAVTELRDNTYYAMITLRINGEDVEIDSRRAMRSRSRARRRAILPPRT